jgi:predicted nucleotidyltransferase component of viral defense system
MKKTDLFQRNLTKERLQDDVLNFVYNSSKYNQLIFTGGTCLRKAYGLNRLSEDLDFDFLPEMVFSVEAFAKDVGEALTVTTKISGNQNTVFLQFPDDVFLRCDFSAVVAGDYQVERRLILADNRQFFVVAYDLPTLFANKIVAFLRRNFFKGKLQQLPFKGRDIYDIYWLLQLSARTGYELKPNAKRLLALLEVSSLAEVKSEVKAKIAEVDPQFVYNDLFALIESPEFLEQFLTDFSKTITKQVGLVL